MHSTFFHRLESLITNIERGTPSMLTPDASQQLITSLRRMAQQFRSRAEINSGTQFIISLFTYKNTLRRYHILLYMGLYTLKYRVTKISDI